MTKPYFLFVVSVEGGGRRVRPGETSRTQCLIPETGLPPVVLSMKQNEGISYRN